MSSRGSQDPRGKLIRKGMDSCALPGACLPAGELALLSGTVRKALSCACTLTPPAFSVALCNFTGPLAGH